MLEQGADIAVLPGSPAADAAALGAEIIGVVMVFFLMPGIFGLCFDGGKADVVVVQIACLRRFQEFEQGAFAGVCKCAVEGEMFKTAADVDIECFGKRIEVAVERTAQALQRRVAGFFQMQVDGMGHMFIRMVGYCVILIYFAGVFASDLAAACR
ncbi:hypothetical protein NEILACOT_03309 [Neisseria lactamica ATCC 23970]|uniref:Uncharacterized protein n=1 Tax=Neisseria lactamica ATCC 23970 TaxID=546265 RepID=D0W717_NEILA|nr:hypothetical protein NEILACOT_03309 [Neisseria lactamica ATCC 23970]